MSMEAQKMVKRSIGSLMRKNVSNIESSNSQQDNHSLPLNTYRSDRIAFNNSKRGICPVLSFYKGSYTLEISGVNTSCLSYQQILACSSLQSIHAKNVQRVTSSGILLPQSTSSFSLFIHVLAVFVFSNFA